MLVAVACILAVGVASTSLDAVETQPSDVMDTSFIPTQDNQPQAGGGGGGGGNADLKPSEGGETSGSPEQTQGTPEESQGGGGGGSQSLQVTFWDRLWYTIMQNLVYIVGTVAALVAAGVGYVVYKRRFAGGASGAADIFYDVDTSNEVYQSWWEMVELTEVEDPMTKTPQEFAETAIEKGYDPDAVTELTRLFEEIHYGGEQVTREEERRAKEAIERIKSKGREAV